MGGGEDRSGEKICVGGKEYTENTKDAEDMEVIQDVEDMEDIEVMEDMEDTEDMRVAEDKKEVMVNDIVMFCNIK